MSDFSGARKYDFEVYLLDSLERAHELKVKITNISLYLERLFTLHREGTMTPLDKKMLTDYSVSMKLYQDKWVALFKRLKTMHIMENEQKAKKNE